MQSFSKVFYLTASEMKAKFSIVFDDEEGIDAGGVQREWFSILSREIFNVDYGLFTISSTGNTYRNERIYYFLENMGKNL